MNKSNKSYKNYFFKGLLAISLPLQFILIQNDRFTSSRFVELYINNFKYLSEFRIRLFSYFLTSIGDIFYFLIIIILIIFLYKNLSYYLANKNHFLIDFFSTLSVLNIFFQVSWGLNYHSQPIELKLNLKKEYSIEELEKSISYLILKTNNLYNNLSKNKTLPIRFPFNKNEARILLADSKKNIVKNSIWSDLLSYMGYSGYLNPFTLEAHVNENIPMMSYLTTIAHEQSHQRGIARENESNYWAFIKTTKNDNNYIKYAGYGFALRYCLSDLYRRNGKKATILSKDIKAGVRKNFQEVDDFWKKHQNPIEPIFKKTYDSFLKINDQNLGIKSYNLVVNLIIHEINLTLDNEKN